MSESFFQARREKLLAGLKETDLAGLLVTSTHNVTYLTGFSGDSSYLLVTPERNIIISDGRYTDQLAEECPNIEREIRPPTKTMQKAVAEVINKLGLTSVGFDSGQMTVAEHQTLLDQTPTVSWKADRGRVENLRAIKDEWELQQTVAAICMAERAMQMLKAMLRGQDTEKELADSIEMYVRRVGGRTTAFPPIVAAGPRAALPHAIPKEEVVGNHPFLLVDWGAAGPFYRSDLTRVLVRNTTSSLEESGANTIDLAKLRQIYNVVLQAQTNAIAALRPGATGGEVDAAARSVITDAGYGENFNHSIGHGIGLQIHEAPLMKPESDLVLQAGMIVTIEPGIYLPGWGGVRIEDDVLITEDGHQVLSRVPKEFDEQFVDY